RVRVHRRRLDDLGNGTARETGARRHAGGVQTPRLLSPDGYAARQSGAGRDVGVRQGTVEGLVAGSREDSDENPDHWQSRLRRTVGDTAVAQAVSGRHVGWTGHWLLRPLLDQRALSA